MYSIWKLGIKCVYSNVMIMYLLKDMLHCHYTLICRLQVAPIIKERMVLKGSLLIGYQPLGDRVNFFRMVVCNSQTTHADMDYALEEIDRLGRDIVI